MSKKKIHALKKKKKKDIGELKSLETYSGIDSLNPSRVGNVTMCAGVSFEKPSKNFLQEYEKFTKSKNSLLFVRRDTKHAALGGKKIFRNKEKLLMFPYMISLYRSVDRSVTTRLDFYLVEVEQFQVHSDIHSVTCCMDLEKEISFVIKFQHAFDFVTFQRLLDIQAYLDNPPDEEIPEIGVPVRDIIRNYSMEEEEMMVTVITRGISNYVTSQAPNEDEGNLYEDITTVPVRNWNNFHFESFLKQVPTVYNRNLISLFEYMNTTGLKTQFDDFLIAFSNADPVSTLFTELNKYKNEEEYVSKSTHVRILCRDDLFRTRMTDHLGYMHKIGGARNFCYVPLFYIMLRKKLVPIFHSNYVQQDLQKRFDLQFEEIRILTKQDLWDFQSMRNKIAFNFCYGMPIQSFVSKLISEFNAMEDSGVFTGLRWLDKLKKFNSRPCFPDGFDFSNIYFKAFMAKRYYTKKARVEQENEVLQTCEAELRLWVSQDREDKEKILTKFEQSTTYKKYLSDRSKTPDLHSPDDWLKKKHKLLTLWTKLYTKRTKDKIFMKRREVERLEKNLSSQSLPKDFPDKLINLRALPALLDSRLLFELSGAYKASMSSLIDHKFSQMMEDRELSATEFALTCQLVFSKHRMQVGGNSVVSSMLQWLVDPDCYKFGCNHVFLVVCNCAFHFFTDGIVYAEDLKHSDKLMGCYEEYVTFNLFRHIVLSKIQFQNFVGGLASQMYEWNLNYTHSFDTSSRIKSTYAKNCQDFTTSLLEKLKLPWPMYPDVAKYLVEVERMESISRNVDDRSNRLRFITYSKKFRRFKRVSTYIEKCIVAQRKFIASVQKKKKVRVDETVREGDKFFFFSHHELDEFVNGLVLLEEEFYAHFQGTWTLLKGFDKSYWISRMHSPTGRNRPLMHKKKCSCHFFSGDTDKKYQVE